MFLVPPQPIDSQLPSENETCRFRIKEFSPWKTATRTENYCEHNNIRDGWDRYLAVVVDGFTSRTVNEMKCEPSLGSLDPLKIEKMSRDKFMHVQFSLRHSSSTRNAEIGALRALIALQKQSINNPAGQLDRRLRVFEYMISSPSAQEQATVDLLKTFPHMPDPTRKALKMPEQLSRRFLEFNRGQRAAYEALRRISHGLAVVPGGPGAGKYVC